MKKALLLLLCVLLLSGCAQKKRSAPTPTDAPGTAEPTTVAPLPDDASVLPRRRGEGVVETDTTLDLRKADRTAAYAALFALALAPGDYFGKTVFLTGTYSSFCDEDLDHTYRAVTLFDEAGCCAQTLYFVPAPDVDPSVFPENGEEVTVSGVLEPYTMGDGTDSYRLRDARPADREE